MKVELDLLNKYKECKKVFKNNAPILEKVLLSEKMLFKSKIREAYELLQNGIDEYFIQETGHDRDYDLPDEEFEAYCENEELQERDDRIVNSKEVKVLSATSDMIYPLIEEEIKVLLKYNPGYKLQSSVEDICNAIKKEQRIKSMAEDFADYIYENCPPILYRNIDEVVNGLPLTRLCIPVEDTRVGYRMICMEDLRKKYPESPIEYGNMEILYAMSSFMDDKHGDHWLWYRGNCYQIVM